MLWILNVSPSKIFFVIQRAIATAMSSASMIRVEQAICILIYSPLHPPSSTVREGCETQQEGCARQDR